MMSPEDWSSAGPAGLYDQFWQFYDAADREVDRFSEEWPELAASAYGRGWQLALGACSGSEIDPMANPATSIMVSAYTKLLFAFTNPHDLEDTLSHEKIVENADRIVQQIVANGEVHDSEQDLQTFAYYAEFLAVHMLLIKTGMQNEGEFSDRPGGYTADEQYDIVRARLEMTLWD